MKERKGITIAVAAFLIIGLAVIMIRQTGTIATVNGEKISDGELSQRLRQQAGRQVLEDIITERLILQEAQEMKVSVNEKEIDDKITELKENFPDEKSFEDNLKNNNMTLAQAKVQLKIRILTEKMMIKDAKVSKEEIQAYYDQNKDTIYKDSKLKKVRAEIVDKIKQQKVLQSSQEWLSSLRKKAKIQNNL